MAATGNYTERGSAQEGPTHRVHPLLTRAEPVISQSTNQSTNRDVLYDLRVLRQPPRTCKSLKNLTGSVHTVEVTGSNPVAPTIRINHLQIILLFCVAPERSNCSAMYLKTLCDRRSPSIRIAPSEGRDSHCKVYGSGTQAMHQADVVHNRYPDFA